MRLVIDSSATLAWIYPDEITAATRRLLDVIAQDGALVPSLWRLEIANGLTAAVRRKRVEASFRDAALRDLALLDILVDPHTDDRAWTTILALADQCDLTLYDAAYLELAQRQALRLATLDAPLLNAARSIGVALFPLD